MPRRLILNFAVVFCGCWLSGICSAAVLFLETFETDGNGTRYTTSVAEFTNDKNDFFIRTDGSNISLGNQFNDIEGSFFFGAQDLDGEGATLPLRLSFSGIDISGFDTLVFSGLFAEDDAGDGEEDWDASDFVLLEYQIDGGGFENLLAFQSMANGFNSAPAQDTNFSGTGDGPELTDTFSEFTADIVGTGSSLDLRFTFDLDSGDEDIALDLLSVSGNRMGGGVVPEPATIGIFAMLGAVGVVRRRRKQQMRSFAK
ncbi:MAG: PEP-CTERM sorting domain-containing protein [Planctomycetota bacterium]